MSNGSDPNFVQALGMIRNGGLVLDGTDKLKALVTAVRETGKAGSITLTLKIKPFSKGDSTTLAVEDAINVKLPTGDKGATVVFATAGGGLQRNDPRQPELAGLRVLEGPKPAIDAKSAAAGE